MRQLHPFVTVENACKGRLESPAYLRKALAPKVNIGAKYEPRKRETLDIREGLYQGFNPSIDMDAENIQKAFLAPKALGEFRRSRPRKLSDVIWWVIAAALVVAFVVVVLAMGDGMPPPRVLR